MKTSKPGPAEHPSSRRAQPLRQTRNNPPKSSISNTRPLGGRASVGGLEDAHVDIFPAITHFADAITALPKELVRHFTLLKEVDAKIFTPEQDLGRLIDAALGAPLPQRPRIDEHHVLGPTSAPMSAQHSLNGSLTNGHAGSAISADAGDVHSAANMAWDPANIPRRQHFQRCVYTMQNMLVSLDEKNHVISTAVEALNKQLARIDDCFPSVEEEFSEDAKYGSSSHWAYPENRVAKTVTVSRREIASANALGAAAQHLAEEAAARSDARKQALLDKKKGKNQQIGSDFDDHHDGRKEKKLHGNSKVRKAADASSAVGLGISNGTNGNAPKRRKVEKGPAGGVVMEKPLSSVLGNGAVAKKVASPRGTPVPEASKKRSRAAATANGIGRKRNNTVNSVAISPSASSPIRSMFLEVKAVSKDIPPPPANGRPASIRARQNSTQSVVEKRPPSSASNKANYANGTATPDLIATITGQRLPDVKGLAAVPKEQALDDVPQEEPDPILPNRKPAAAKVEELEANGDSMQGIQSTAVVTKSGRASKPSTPAIPQFPEPLRSRSSRALDVTSNNKRSHKKGAGAAAQLLAQAQKDDDGTSDIPDEDEEIDVGDDEPRYCYCDGVSYGEMVGCDANDCEREWFHLECVGLKVAPKGNAKWYCDDCKEKMKPKRFNPR